jgi:hypothetical protein
VGGACDIGAFESGPFTPPGPPPPPPAVALDAFVCYGLKDVEPRQPTAGHLASSDPSLAEASGVEIQRPVSLCAPASLAGGAIADPLTHLMGYSLKTPAAPPAAPPTASHAVDHYRCYAVKENPASTFIKIEDVALVDQFIAAQVPGGGPKVFDLKKPERFCVAVDKNGEGVKSPLTHLACYKANAGKGQPKHAAVNVFLNNQFGPEDVLTTREEEVCIPSTLGP